jgi:type III pantothenate kinase
MTCFMGVADAGNSRTKWAIYHNGTRHCSGVWNQPSDILPETALGAGRWRLAGVHPEQLLNVCTRLEQFKIPCEIISKTASFGLKLDIDYPDKVGIDRVAAAWAAWLRFERKHSCIVVDAGTALTIDLVDKSGAFLGGAILPGIDLMLQSLAEGTRLLPRIQPSSIDAALCWPGKNTTAAMTAGVLAAQMGAINTILEKARLSIPTIKIVITGGGGKLLADACGLASCYIDGLVLEGIARAGEPQP